jgi:MurNAc alpha-1-phosphate uridylyltransferase
MKNFSLMILAAGYGRRMKYLTHTVPKPLLKINNKELLSYNIDFFIKLGCNKIVINTHYLHNEIKIFVEKKFSNQNIKLIFEPELLNTGGGIKNALSYFDNKNFLVTNSDILWNDDNAKDIYDFIKEYQEIQYCKLLLVENKKFKGLKKREGDFKLENDLISRWKINDPHLYFSGLQIINPNIFSQIKKDSFSMNLLWDILIKYNQLQGQITNSIVTHIGDINSYNEIKNI